jgi:hypothetical protein
MAKVESKGEGWKATFVARKVEAAFKDSFIIEKKKNAT